MTKLWVDKFRDLPEIPTPKRWREGFETTLEQDVTLKILTRQPINEEERNILCEAISFYKNVIPQLHKIELENLNDEDRASLLGYFNYVFNFFLTITNEITCNYTARLVKNEDVIKKRKSIEDTKYLKYPPLTLVKEIGKYNRASTSNSTVFYGAECCDATLLETKPKKNDLVTVGVWKYRHPEKKIMTYPITFGKEAIQANPHTKKGYDYFQKVKEINDPQLMEFMEIFFDFLGLEFSKQVVDHYQYFYSAIYSDKIFENTDPVFNAIVYPSVQNRFKYHNIAIRHTFFDEEFYIDRIFEFEIEDTFYDQEFPFSHAFHVSYVKPKNVREPKQIDIDGKIIW
jgi:hypothetical protein